MSNAKISKKEVKIFNAESSKNVVDWKDCDLEICQILNNWLNADDIKNFAMFDLTFTEELLYYQNNTHIFLGEIKNFLKVVFIDSNLIGYVVLNYGYYDGKYVLGINPIVINPQERKKGFAKLIIKDLINNYSEICNIKNLDRIEANISVKNKNSIKLFSSMNFEKVKSSEDNLFDLYQYKIKSEKALNETIEK